MGNNTLTFRKAEARDLDAAEAIYDKIHAREDAGLTTIGWVTGDLSDPAGCAERAGPGRPVCLRA